MEGSQKKKEKRKKKGHIPGPFAKFVQEEGIIV